VIQKSLVKNDAGKVKMARVPITMMGFRCEQCGHEWIPRRDIDDEPKVCPSCRSSLWNSPKRSMMSYDDFKIMIAKTLRDANSPLTWTQIRTTASLPQMFPNNQWVHRMETDIGLVRERSHDGTIYWRLKETKLVEGNSATTKAAIKPRSRASRK
jgi:hypothetical protein